MARKNSVVLKLSSNESRLEKVARMKLAPNSTSTMSSANVDTTAAWICALYDGTHLPEILRKRSGAAGCEEEEWRGERGREKERRRTGSVRGRGRCMARPATTR